MLGRKMPGMDKWSAEQRKGERRSRKLRCGDRSRERVLSSQATHSSRLARGARGTETGGLAYPGRRMGSAAAGRLELRQRQAGWSYSSGRQAGASVCHLGALGFRVTLNSKPQPARASLACRWWMNVLFDVSEPHALKYARAHTHARTLYTSSLCVSRTAFP